MRRSEDAGGGVVLLTTIERIGGEGIHFHPDTDEKVRRALMDSLLGMAEKDTRLGLLTDVYGWTALNKAEDSYFDTYRKLLESAGITISELP